LRVHERTAELERTNRALQAEIVDRRQAEQALQQAQKMEAVGQLTGGIAHDFNNLLMVIMGNLQILGRHVGADAFAGELIEAALKAARRGSDLNRTLLAFSRKQQLAPVAVDFNELIAGLAGMLRRTLGEPVQVVLAPAPDLPLALADPGLMETALLNLAVNGRDAMPAGGTLTIETAAVDFDECAAELAGDVAAGPYVMLAVSDNGVGMAPEVAARAFEPFFTTKETGKGSGLGLAMVYGFAKQSGGHARIYSEPGLGTTVKLFLPRFQGAAEPVASAGARAVTQPTGSESILVVEDEDDVRKLVCRILAGLGYRIVQARDGAAALEVLEREQAIDLLWTDVVLPGGMSGPEIARRARLLRPSLKVLFASGYTGSAIQELGPPIADVPLISKPFTIEDLAQAVRTALDSDDRPGLAPPPVAGE
jgi:nitrogen-specific signal transduction histidine kinase/ActR/RegA family two-component response regulator